MIMKIEMYEKVAEIIVANVRTAEENKRIAAETRALMAEEERRREEERKQKEQKRAKELLPIIIEKINTSALLGNNTLSFSWGEDTEAEISFDDWNIFCKYHKDYFVELGYKFCVHEYSKSWRERSGRIGYATIYWC